MDCKGAGSWQEVLIRALKRAVETITRAPASATSIALEEGTDAQQRQFHAYLGAELLGTGIFLDHDQQEDASEQCHTHRPIRMLQEAFDVPEGHHAAALAEIAAHFEENQGDARVCFRWQAA